MWWKRRTGAGVSRRAAKRARFFEQLESRQMMAVTTSLSGGSLTITGDAAGDNIAVVGTANPGEFVVFGRDGTAVNGVANGSVMIPGVTGSMTVNLNGGNDVLSLDSVFVAGAITIDTADGNDAVALGAHSVVSPAGNLTINTGAGNDQVAELGYAVFIGGAHAVDLGAGDDIATLIGLSAVGGTYGVAFQVPTVPSIEVHGRDGNDSLLGIGVTARLILSLQGDLGINSLALINSAGDSVGVTAAGGNLYIDTVFAVTGISVSTTLGTAPFNDSSISVFRCQCTTMHVAPGGGNNFVHIYGNAVNGPPYVIRGGEPGSVFPNLFVGSARSVSGTPFSNQNTVLITYNLAVQTTVILGDGNDTLSLTGNYVTDLASLHGASGVNTLSSADNVFGFLATENFV